MNFLLNNLLFQQIIFYVSYPFAFFLAWKLWRALIGLRILGFLFWLLLFGLFIWVRFREPYQIQVQHTTISVGFHKNVMLISDLHLGVYKDESYLLDVVNTINMQTGIDMVLIAGDLTFLPGNKDLTVLFSPLRLSKYPIYAVLGNHDEQKPGPDLKYHLVHALEMNGVYYLENDAIDLIDMVLIGLGDRFASNDDTHIISRFLPENNVLVLTHNPDTIRSYTNTLADITLAGHTHCGQVRIPYLYKFMIPTQGSWKERFDCGFYTGEQTKLFITPGLGEDALPFRFLNKPTINILYLR